MDVVTILLSAFVVSTVALGLFIWSMRRGVLDDAAGGADVIFVPHEKGHIEDPSCASDARGALQAEVKSHAAARVPADARELEERIVADDSSAPVVFIFLCCSVVWLLVASFAGLTASIKLHSPDWLADYEWLTFGRIRTIHLNALAYGWLSMAGLGLSIWLMPRLLKTSLKHGGFAVIGAMVWNAGLIAGLGAIAVGFSSGREWLEIPWQVGLLLAAGGALIALPLVYTLQSRRVGHLYVSVWYMGAALFWFPILYFVANIPGLHIGVEEATMNWWYGHSVLGLFFTPLALASIYYFMPKVIGRPVASYNLSLLGFWTLAFFYGQIGGHHLIGGPVPGWVITLSIVQSMMMITPVLAFAINQYRTMEGYNKALLYSPTLRFVSFAGIMYVATSFQGSFESLRSMNAVTHFTHYTVGHAHLGLYGFVSMAFFGGIYFVMPRVMHREWPYPRLILWHFWLAGIGILIYFGSLTIGGWLQGQAMLDAARPFMESVAVTLRYLQLRTLGGVLMTLGHLMFAAHFVAMILKLGPERDRPAFFHQPAANG